MKQLVDIFSKVKDNLFPTKSEDQAELKPKESTSEFSFSGKAELNLKNCGKVEIHFERKKQLKKEKEKKKKEIKPWDQPIVTKVVFAAIILAIGIRATRKRELLLSALALGPPLSSASILSLSSASGHSLASPSLGDLSQSVSWLKSDSQSRSQLPRSCSLEEYLKHRPVLKHSDNVLTLNSKCSELNIRLVKLFWMGKIVTLAIEPKLEVGAEATEPKLEAAKADLSFKEEKKSQSKNKKKRKNSKRTSTSMSRPLDMIVEHEPSANLEPEGTSQSLTTGEEDFMEPEESLASEGGGLEISSNTDNRDEATEIDHGMQNLSKEESALGEAAAIYNSAFDVTLKALLNIKVRKEDLKHIDQPFPEDQVPCALQKFFTSFGSEEIKKEGNYSVLLSDLLASLKQMFPMSSDAAEVLVEILEFWQCWKHPERESLVTRLFTLEEIERMSGKKCGRKSNYPEQISYGIVTAADSVRNMKCAFGNMKYVDILKLIRSVTEEELG